MQYSRHVHTAMVQIHKGFYSSLSTLVSPEAWKEKTTIWTWALMEILLQFGSGFLGPSLQYMKVNDRKWKVGVRNGDFIFFLPESQAMPVRRVCQHPQELKPGPFATIYKQEINTWFRISYARFTDTSLEGLLHIYKELYEDILKSYCPQVRHDNCQYEHSHFITNVNLKRQKKPPTKNQLKVN